MTKNLLDDIITQLYNAGFIVVAIVSDSVGENHSVSNDSSSQFFYNFDTPMTKSPIDDTITQL